jgi:hypothetical protein
MSETHTKLVAEDLNNRLKSLGSIRKMGSTLFVKNLFTAKIDAVNEVEREFFAELFLNRLNSHDAMLTALKFVRTSLHDRFKITTGRGFAVMSEMLETIDNAIKLAEGK